MTENGLTAYMPVAPTYGGGGMGGFGSDWWLILILLFACGGWGFGGGMGGFGNMALGYDFPWLLNGQNAINQNTNTGFQNALLNDNVTSIRDGVSGLSTQMCNGFGNVATQLCGGFAGVNASINGAQSAITQQMYANEIADLERSFAAQTASTQGLTNVSNQLSNCCCENRLSTAQTQSIVQNEGNATRFADANNTRDIIENQNRNSQAIIDKLCALELDGVKNQLAQAQRENVGLQNQLNMATLRESQTAQNAFISQGFANEVDQLYNRLSNCPVPTTPVYGRTPIFTCNNGCGCGGTTF